MIMIFSVSACLVLNQTNQQPVQPIYITPAPSQLNTSSFFFIQILF